ncbi:MAG: hypothetical protein ACP5E3_03145 [Bacteroidales bacterium]
MEEQITGEEIQDEIPEPDVAGQEDTGETVEEPGVADQVEGDEEAPEGEPEEGEPGKESPNIEELINEIEGLKKAVIGERRSRQLAQAQLQMFMKQSQKTTQESPSSDDDDEVILTKKEVSEIVNTMLAQQQSQKQSPSFEELKARVTAQESEFKKTHPDYDELTNEYSLDYILGNEELGIPQNLELFFEIVQSDNAPQALYNLAYKHPKYQERLKREGAKELTQKMKKASSKSPGLSGAGRAGNRETDEARRIAEMSDEEFDAYVNKIKGVD